MPRPSLYDDVVKSNQAQIHDWIIHLRKKYHITQLELASRVGISPTYFSSLENGKRVPSYALLEKMADTFSEIASLRAILGDLRNERRVTTPPPPILENELTMDDPLFKLFDHMGMRSAVDTGRFRLEVVQGEELIVFGIFPGTMVVTEVITSTDRLTSGELVSYHTDDKSRWGFTYKNGSHHQLNSPGFIMAAALRGGGDALKTLGYENIEILQFDLSPQLETIDLRVARFIIARPINARQSFVTNPFYRSLHPEDRVHFDWLLYRFHQDRKGETSFQPTVPYSK